MPQSMADLQEPLLLTTSSRDAETTDDKQHGSTIGEAIFNFTNGIVGAGAIGLGGAMAQSGGAVSIVALIVFATLTKISLDMVIDLSLKYGNGDLTGEEKETGAHRSAIESNVDRRCTAMSVDTTEEMTIQQQCALHKQSLLSLFSDPGDTMLPPPYAIDSPHNSDIEVMATEDERRVINVKVHNKQQQQQHSGSFEDLGQLAFGWTGRTLVSVSKFVYSFGCLVAYVIVVRDNFGSAALSLLYGSDNDSHESTLAQFLHHDAWVTWTTSLLVMFPLCLMRDLTPLSRFSFVSVVAMISIVGIVLYIYFAHPDIREQHRQHGNHTTSTYEIWWQIRPGFVESLGTFVFAFVSQHTVHLLFDSLQPRFRTAKHWSTVSSTTLTIATAISISVALTVYLTFGLDTTSDIFKLYPATPLMDAAKLLLCFTMLLTFPIPFLACREIIIVTFYAPLEVVQSMLSTVEVNEDEEIDPSTIIATVASADSAELNDSRSTASLADLSVLSSHAVAAVQSCLLPGDSRQLKWVYHVILTGKLWFVVTGLAIEAPNLGDILDLIGCASGALIAFVLPACIAFKLEGYSHKAAFILAVGAVVGVVGTFYSVCKLYTDIA